MLVHSFNYGWCSFFAVNNHLPSCKPYRIFRRYSSCFADSHTQPSGTSRDLDTPCCCCHTPVCYPHCLHNQSSTEGTHTEISHHHSTEHIEHRNDMWHFGRGPSFLRDTHSTPGSRKRMLKTEFQVLLPARWSFWEITNTLFHSMQTNARKLSSLCCTSDGKSHENLINNNVLTCCLETPNEKSPPSLCSYIFISPYVIQLVSLSQRQAPYEILMTVIIKNHRASLSVLYWDFVAKRELDHRLLLHPQILFSSKFVKGLH